MGLAEHRLDAVPTTTLTLCGSEERHSALIHELNGAFGELLIESADEQTKITIPWAIYHNGAGGERVHSPWPHNPMWKGGEQTRFKIPEREKPSSVSLSRTALIGICTTWDRYNPFLSFEQQEQVPYLPREIAKKAEAILPKEDCDEIALQDSLEEALALLFVLIETRRAEGTLSENIDQIYQDLGLGETIQFFG